MKRLTVPRGYGLGYPKRRPRGHSLGSPCVGSPGNPYLPPPPGFLPALPLRWESFGLFCARCVAQITWVSFPLSMDPSCFSFHRLLCNLLLCRIWEKNHTLKNGIHKEFQFLDDELVFGHQQTELLSLNSCCFVFLLH